VPDLNLFRNPYYQRLGNFLARLTPVGSTRSSFGNQGLGACRDMHRSHSFKSENAFDLFAYGEMLSVGGATNGKRLQKGTTSHNSILIDGRGQQYSIEHPQHPFAGRVIAYAQRDGVVYFCGDATWAYSQGKRNTTSTTDSRTRTSGLPRRNRGIRGDFALWLCPGRTPCASRQSTLTIPA